MINLLLQHRPHASPILQDAMIAYIEYRATSKHGPWTELGLKKLMNKAQGVPDLTLAAAFRDAIAHNWQGVFPERLPKERVVAGFSMDPKVWEAWRP
jgi:hypothetical protein